MTAPESMILMEGLVPASESLVAVKFVALPARSTLAIAGLVVFESASGCKKTLRAAASGERGAGLPNLSWERTVFENSLLALQLRNRDDAVNRVVKEIEAALDGEFSAEGEHGEFHSLALAGDSPGLAKFLRRLLSAPTGDDELEVHVSVEEEAEEEAAGESEEQNSSGPLKDVYPVNLMLSPVKGVSARDLRMGAVVPVALQERADHEALFGEPPEDGEKWFDATLMMVDENNESAMTLWLKFKGKGVGKAVLHPESRVLARTVAATAPGGFIVPALVSVIAFMAVIIVFMAIFMLVW